MSRGTLVGITLAVSGLCVVAACVGSDPDSGSSSSTSSGGSSGGSSGAGGDGGPSCAGDTTAACGASCTKCAEPAGGKATCSAGTCGITCDAPKTGCGSTCVDLANDANNCGRCDRKCGGPSSCSESRCATQVMQDASFSILQVIAAGPNLYFSTASDIQRAAKTAGAAPTVFFRSPDQVGYPAVVHDRSLSADAQRIYWAGSRTESPSGTPEAVPGIFAQGFADLGPTRIASYASASYEPSAATDGVTAAWSAGAGYKVYACTAGTGCAAETDTAVLERADAPQPQTVALSGTTVAWTEYNNPGNGKLVVSASKGTSVKLATTYHPTHLVVFGTDYYWVDEGHEDKTTVKGGIFRCAVAGCQDAPTKVAEWDDTPTQVAVDASGIYFTVRGSDVSTTGALVVCRDLVKGCSGAGTASPEILAKNLERPKAMALDATDVFFTVHPTTTTSKILRIAK